MAMRGRVTKSAEFRQAVMCVTLLQVSMAAECRKHQSTYSAYRMLFALNGQHLCKFTPFFPASLLGLTVRGKELHSAAIGTAEWPHVENRLIIFFN